MEITIEQFLGASALSFMLVFARIGSVIMIMPGIGDSFVPGRIRLHIALAVSLVMMPIIYNHIPHPLPGVIAIAFMTMGEVIIGLLIGTVARILIAALDVAGMVISTASGLGNAQIFNPSLAMQGSVVGAFLSVTGTVLLMVMNLHHMLIAGVANSYNLFPPGKIPDSGDMAVMIARTVSSAFTIGVQIASPFIVLSVLIYVGMGVLSRLMPQIQVFLLALPLQIMLSLITLGIVVSAVFLYWTSEYRDAISVFLQTAGG